jgi:hypothetical protein
MKKLLIILAVILTGCIDTEIKPTETEKSQTFEKSKSGSISILFKDTGELISFNKLIIVDQLNDFEIYGYFGCDNQIRFIKKEKTYEKALLLLEQITIEGYYIIE